MLRNKFSEERTSSEMKLLKITLPIFSGNYSERIPFSDLFHNTVDQNQSLSSIQKLHYLRTSLKSEPARLLSQLPAMSAIYAVAIQLLNERYNKRIITHTHRDALQIQTTEP